MTMIETERDPDDRIGAQENEGPPSSYPPGGLPGTGSEQLRSVAEERLETSEASVQARDETEDYDPATEAALRELQRLDTADHYQPPPMPERLQYSAPVVMPRQYTAPHPQPVAPTAAPRPDDRMPMAPGPWSSDRGAAPAPPQVIPSAPNPKDLRTLEDLYAVFPQIGDGEHFLRIERTKPAHFGGYNTRGVLEDVHEQMHVGEIRQRHGGGTYVISVIGPVRNAPARADGVRAQRTLASIEISIPGPPASGARSSEDDMTARMPTVGRGDGDAQVQIKRLEMEDRAAQRSLEEQRRREQEFSRAVQPPEKLLDAATDLAAKTVEMSERHFREVESVLRERCDSQQQLITALNAEIKALEGQVREAERKALDAERHHETEATRNLRERYEADLSRERQAYAQRLTELGEQHRNAMSEEQRRHADERARLDADWRRQNERLIEDRNAREHTMSVDHAKSIEMLKLTYDNRVADLTQRTADQIVAAKESAERELRTARESFERELRGTKEMHASKGDFLERTNAIEISAKQTELEAARSRIARLEQENETLRAAQHKDPGVYILETKTFAKEILGMVDGNEASAGSSTDDSGDFKKIAGRVLENIATKFPDIMNSIGSMRAQNQAAAAHAQAAQAQAAAPRALPPMAPMAPHQPPPQPRRRQPPAWAAQQQQAPQPQRRPGQPMPSMTATDAPAVVPGVRQVASPIQPDMPSPSAQPQEEATSVSQPQSQQSPPQPTMTPDQEQMGQMVTQLINELEGAIRGGIITPTVFAKSLLQRVEPHIATQLTSLNAEELLDGLDGMAQRGEIPGDLHLLSRDGRKYVRETLDVARAELRAAGHQA